MYRSDRDAMTGRAADMQSARQAERRALSTKRLYDRATEHRSYLQQWLPSNASSEGRGDAQHRNDQAPKRPAAVLAMYRTGLADMPTAGQAERQALST